MKRWAIVVAVLYALMLGVLSLPVVVIAMAPLHDFPNLREGWKSVVDMAAGTYGAWQWWLWLVVMGLAQASLLSVPVRLAGRRPVTRQPLVLTVLAGGLMMGALVIGGIFSLCEFGLAGQDIDKTTDVLIYWIPLGMGVLAWCGWGLIFFRLGRTTEPNDFVSRLCKTLLKGSILELLIAVPTHIIARYRDYCCAGFLTFIGLTCGISVMLFSFGPGIFFLFVARWRRLHPEADH